MFLAGYPSLTPSFEGNPFTQGYEILSLKTRVIGAAYSEDFVILACAIMIGLKGVTDGQTNKRTDRRTPRRWLRRAKHAVARNNQTKNVIDLKSIPPNSLCFNRMFLAECTDAVADLKGGCPSIDRMHFKTSENFARKCIIFD